MPRNYVEYVKIIWLNNAIENSQHAYTYNKLINKKLELL